MYGLSLKWCEHKKPTKEFFYWHSSSFRFESRFEAVDYALELISKGVEKLGLSKYPFHRVVDYKVFPMEYCSDDYED